MLEASSSFSYKIKQAEFNGPIELLLDLIRKKKVDIYLIKISDIVKGFLDYIKSNKKILLDELSGFLYIAVLLLEYKSRNLLPSSTGTKEEEQEIDSDLLMKRQKEYLVFKNVAIHMESLYDKEKFYFVREAAIEKRLLDVLPDFLEGLDLQTISSLADKLFKDRPEEGIDLQKIYDDEIKITVSEEMDRIIDILVDNKKHTFRDLSNKYDKLIDKIICFLSLLELYKREKIEILQFERFGNIVVKIIAE